MNVNPLKTLLNAHSDATAPRLIPELQALFGGDLDVRSRELPGRPWVVASWVESLDGIISYSDIPGKEGGNLVAGSLAQDRLMVALLRLMTDARLFGLGTLRKELEGVGTPEDIAPEFSKLFDCQRAAAGISARTTSILLAGSADIPREAKIFHTESVKNIVYIPSACAKDIVLPAAEVRALVPNDGERRLLEELFEQDGIRTLLVEGGPTVWGNFLKAGLIDELFITISPRIIGNARDVARPTPVQGALFAPETSPQWRLVGAKTAEEFLFLRYERLEKTSSSA